MSVETRFIPHALRAISEAVVEVIGKTGLHVRKDTLSQRLARRAGSQIRALEQMLRRVIMLMALAILPNLKIPLLKRPHITIAGLAGPQTIKRPKDRNHILRGSKAPSLPPLSIGAIPPDFSSATANRAAQAPSAAKLIARIQTLKRILENPQHMARRLASHYARSKAARKDRPLLPPNVHPRHARAELALIAGALPMELTRALAKWHDTS